jgi:hypothetical protein
MGKSGSTIIITETYEQDFGASAGTLNNGI